MIPRLRRISRNLWKYVFSLTVSDTSLLDAYRDHVYVSYGHDVRHYDYYQRQNSALEY